MERYLKLFTFVSTAKIALVMAEHAADPAKRKAQHLLASEVLELVHGRDEAEKTRDQHQSVRQPSLAALSKQSETTDAKEFSTLASQLVLLPSSLVLNTPFSRILFHAGLVPTKSEGSRLISKGGAYVAEAALSENSKDAERADQLTFIPLRDQKPEQVKDFVFDGILMLRVGKWKTRIVKVIGDADFDARRLEAPGWDEWKKTRPQQH